MARSAEGPADGTQFLSPISFERNGGLAPARGAPITYGDGIWIPAFAGMIKNENDPHLLILSFSSKGGEGIILGHNSNIAELVLGGPGERIIRNDKSKTHPNKMALRLRR